MLFLGTQQPATFYNNIVHETGIKIIIQCDNKLGYKDMSDDNFMTNQKLLGNYVHEIEILLLAKIRRMAIIYNRR